MQDKKQDKSVNKKRLTVRIVSLLGAVVIFCGCFFAVPAEIKASAFSYTTSAISVVDAFAPDYIDIEYKTTTTTAKTLITDFSGSGGVNVSASHPSDDSSLDLYKNSITFSVGDTSTRTFAFYDRVNSKFNSSFAIVGGTQVTVPYWSTWNRRYITSLRYPSAVGDLKVVLHWDYLVTFVSDSNPFPVPTIGFYKTLTSTSIGNGYLLGSVGGIDCKVSGELYNEYGLVGPVLTYNLASLYDVELLPSMYNEEIPGKVRIYKDLEFVFTASSLSTACYMSFNSVYVKPGFSFSRDSIYYLEKMGLWLYPGFVQPEINRDYVSWVVTSVGSFFDMELLPGFTLGGVFFTVLTILLSLYFLKLFAGG